MKKITSLLNIGILTILFFSIISCTEDNPVIERTWAEGCVDPGTLEVFVKIGQISTNYASGAEVYIYADKDSYDNGETEIDFDLTDADDPRPGSGEGALFTLPFSAYFVYARWRESASYPWKTGAQENVFVPTCNHTEITVAID